MQKNQYPNKVEISMEEIENMKTRIDNNIIKNEKERQRIFDENMKEYKEYFRTLLEPNRIPEHMEYLNKTKRVAIMEFGKKEGVFISFLGKFFGKSKSELLFEKSSSISKEFHKYILKDSVRKNCEIAKELYEEIFPNKFEFECYPYNSHYGYRYDNSYLYVSIVDEKKKEDLLKRLKNFIW